MIRAELILGACIVYLMVSIEWAIACFVVWSIVYSVFDGQPNPKHMPKRWREANGYE